MIENNLTFTAKCVTCDAHSDEFNISSTCTIYFGEGDPGQDGHAWTFYSGAAEIGGCVVQGKQQRGLALDEIIKEAVLSHSRLECVFNERGSAKTGINTLTILYDLREGLWQGLAHNARRIFASTGSNFKLID
jgi:hypothetical protein